MAKLHSASPREITSPFTREIISELYSKACNYLYVFSGDYAHFGKLLVDERLSRTTLPGKKYYI